MGGVFYSVVANRRQPEGNWEDVFSRREREREWEEKNGSGNERLSLTVGMGSNGNEKHGDTGRVCICGNRLYDGFPSRSRPVPSTSGIPVPLLPV